VVICICEVTDISPSNLDSSLWFIQLCISHNVLCIEVKLAGWQYTALMYSLPYLEPVCWSMYDSNCCFLTCIQVSNRRQVKWSGIPISCRIFHFVVIYTVKGFRVVNETEGGFVFLFLFLFPTLPPEFSSFFCDLTNVGNLIFSPSAFSKTSLYVLKFSVHVLLKPGLKDFKNYFVSM